MIQRRRLLTGAFLASVSGAFIGRAWADAALPSSSLVSLFGPPLKSPPKRVFVAGPPAAVLVAALAPDALLGWPSRLTDDARAMLSAPLAALPTLGRLGGRGSSITTEALLALRPDVVIDVGTVDDYYRSQAQRTAAQTGIPYMLVDGRLPQTAQQLREVGAVLGVAERAEVLASYAEQTLQQGQALRTQWQQPPRVYLARSADGLETGWRGAINAELLEYMGAHNVATVQAQEGAGAGPTGNVGRVSLEQVLKWNPDWIVTQEAGLAERLRANPLWRSIQAVQTGQVLQAPHVPFGWVDGPPGINRLIGLRWLTLALQGWSTHPAVPTAVANATPELTARVQAEAKAFYTLFYGTREGAMWPAGALPWA